MSYASTLDNLRATGNFRTIPGVNPPADIVDLSSNDYLGLAQRPELMAEFMERYSRGDLPAMTSSASRLLAHDQREYVLLEQQLSELYNNRPCLLFNSGYHANTGLLSALASERGSLIVADRLVHASMIDGMILSRSPFRRFAHNDLNHLESILSKEAGRYDRVIVSVESVYSMDGDSPDLEGLLTLKHRYPNVVLYVDEAHAFGVVGPRGLGLVAGTSKPDEFDVIVGTFGKAAASMGAFAIMSPTIRDYAVNRSRSLIFSTALPHINVAWTRMIVDKIIGMDSERAHLAAIGRKLSEAMLTPTNPSHIIPYIVGDPGLTVELSGKLHREGFKVLPIRTPTVAAGTERLRISLSAALSETTIDQFINVLKAL